MTPKHKNKNKNKTRKRFSGVSIPNSINISKNNSYSELDREKALACFLANNDKVKTFAFEVFYFIISYWKKHYPRKWKTIIGNELLEKINGKIIDRIGFTEIERDQIYKTKNKQELINFLNDKFFKVTSVLNNLSKPDFVFFHVDVSENLQNIFINNLEKLFLLTNFTWNDFVKMYNSSPKSYKKSYNFFIFNIIIYGSNNKNNMSLYKKNLIYFDFIKKNLPQEEKNKSSFLKKINNCNKSSISEQNYKDFTIYDARNFYKIDKKMPYAKIMEKMNEPYLSGPSGSTSILYINLFEFYSFPKTKENKVMLLCLIIADYIPLWHTLPEILLSANVELQPFGIPNYTLDEEPVNYALKIIEPYL